MILDQLAADFLLRLSQEREAMLAAILVERTAGSDEGARIKLECECLRRIGVPLSVVRRTPPEGLLELVQRGGDLTFRSIMLAELLLQDAESSEKGGDVRNATGRRLQAFCLIAASVHVLTAEEQVGYRARLESLAKELRSISDDPYLLGKIDEYYAKT
jgi:hypothetical protein